MTTGKIIRRDTAWKNTVPHHLRKKKNRDEYSGKSYRHSTLDALGFCLACRRTASLSGEVGEAGKILN